jgi:hypothetical protein
VLWSKISGAILPLTLHAFGGFMVAPRAAVLVTRDVKTFASFSFCAWYHMIISHDINVSQVLSSLFCVESSPCLCQWVVEWTSAVMIQSYFWECYSYWAGYDICCAECSVQLVMYCCVLLATVKSRIQFEGVENRVLRRTQCLDLRGRKLH